LRSCSRGPGHAARLRMGCGSSRADLPEEREVAQLLGVFARGWGRSGNILRTGQGKLVPQSLRGGQQELHRRRLIGTYIAGDSHAEACFEQFARNEHEFCGEWAVFYHSYWLAALLYEVQAALAGLLFGFPAEGSPLPRLLADDFADTPDARSLMSALPSFETEFPGKADHHPKFRKVAISAMCSLLASGPEVCIAKHFRRGYSCKALPYRGLLEKLLKATGVPAALLTGLIDEVVSLAEGYGLDASAFGGGGGAEGRRAGHLLQVFVKRDFVDKLSYAAEPYGTVDKARMPMTSWLGQNTSFSRGQARIVAHPAHFLQPEHVRIFWGTADSAFHASRARFQQDLAGLLGSALGGREQRLRAAQRLGGPWIPTRAPQFSEQIIEI